MKKRRMRRLQLQRETLHNLESVSGGISLPATVCVTVGLTCGGGTVCYETCGGESMCGTCPSIFNLCGGTGGTGGSIIIEPIDDDR